MASQLGEGMMAETGNPWAEEALASPIPNNAIQLKDLLDRARQVLRTAFKEPVWVLAEVQAIRTADRGHVYLTLVDVDRGQAQTKGNLWASRGAQRLAELEQARGERLSKGEKVFVLCTPEYHPTYGFSVTVNDIQFADTLGPAERALRQALKRLKDEGLISRNRELLNPQVVFRVALVAPRAAEGSLDFRRILFQERTRAPIVVRQYQATFQGEGAAQEIPIAISRACGWQPDLIVLARGGGSKADLLYLNNYTIGRAICDCQVPVWSGIGHSTDKTLVDEVAHKAFKTPSDVAHQIVNLVQIALGEVAELSRSVARIGSSMTERANHGLQRDWIEARNYSRGSLEKAARRKDDVATTASSCGRIITEIWVRHLALCREGSIAAASASLVRASASCREQAQMSVSASKLLGERWTNSLRSHRTVAAGAIRTLFRNLEGRAQSSYNLCKEASRLALRRLQTDIAHLRHSIEASPELCLEHLGQELEVCWQEPKKAVEHVLVRASTQVRQSAQSIRSLLSVQVRSVQVAFGQSFLLAGQASHLMIGQRKLLIDNHLKLARHFAETAIVRGQVARDQLRAAAEAADVHGPLGRGFVMVTDGTGRWLRAAADTVHRMRLVYVDGVVRVQKDEPEAQN
jgi:exodeoxyribonuclease VII large subunit